MCMAGGSSGGSSGASVGGGAVTGAASGSTFGPWGAAIGAVLGAAGGYMQSKAEKDSLKYQEVQARQNAALQGAMGNDAMARGMEAAQDKMREISSTKATQAAVLAANGMDISQGTPKSLLDDTQYMGDIDLSRINRNAQREAWGFGVQGNNYANTSRMIGANADSINPLASGLLAGAGSVASNWSAFSGGK